MTDAQPPANDQQPPAKDARPPARRHPWWMVGAGLAVLAAAAVAVSMVAVTRAGSGQASESQQLRPTGIPASVTDSQASLMQLTPLPVKAAPDFTLTDQDGRTLSLSSLRGKVVVLEFMDPHCTDICPIVSQEFVDAYHDLGREAGKVVFAAVNVNQYYAKVSDTMAFSREQRLITIPSWHFFTGTVPQLRAVWRGYDVTVEAPSPNADIVHTSAVYFIDPSGHERFLASPQDDHTSSGAAYLPPAQLTEWGQGIAQMARLLAG